MRVYDLPTPYVLAILARVPFCSGAFTSPLMLSVGNSLPNGRPPPQIPAPLQTISNIVK